MSADKPHRIRRIVAPNPSYMTGAGTNTYIIGSGQVAVIDPGPALDAHLRAILASLGPGEAISHIFVTHSHLDHSALAPKLSEVTGARTHAFGPAGTGRSLRMIDLEPHLPLLGGEGVDQTFSPDLLLADNEQVTATSWALTAVHTPGHFGNHLCFAWDDLLFSGDHVMEWSTSLISPPDGDMTDYMSSLAKLEARPWRQFLPGHGDMVENPASRLADLIRHRRMRESAILDELAKAPIGLQALTRAIYTDLAANLIPAAERNVLAHLIDLAHRNLAEATPVLSPGAVFSCR